MPKAFYSHLVLLSVPALCPNIRILSIALLSRNPDWSLNSRRNRFDVPSWALQNSFTQAKTLRRLWEHFPRFCALGIRANSLAWADSLRRTSFNQVTETDVHCSVSEDAVGPLQALVDM
ncbi:hypothetical protein EDD16DRAFT_1230252 [Pisolithus croceorrhizus]|nr:hypothetical protein EDD16DRAFT_1230252 [Pisolithus croceorrhizus]KAI6159859.1 hypothetical protein EDD17DRAFT_877915 [Pisolithus thermaeus]